MGRLLFFVFESKMKIFICSLALVFLAYHYATATKFQSCGDPSGWITSLQVSDCPDSAETCILKRGTSKNISIVFDSKTTAKTVKAVVHGVIAGVPLPFFLPQADGCTYGGLSCPLENGKSYTYSHGLDIKTLYPPFEVKVRWELQDEAKDDIICIEIPCKIE